ncbi:MAG: Ppx/GppA phosphatase family protein [Candidatus Brocadiia bacterium]
MAPAPRKNGNGSDHSNPAFPIKVAAIDVGSNAIRFGAAEFHEPRKYSVLYDDRVSVRLGHGVFVSGKLSRSAMDSALTSFISFRGIMDEQGIRHCRAVATSAVRESSNGGDFIKAVKRESGITLNVISGGEEARVVYKAVRSRMSLGQRQWIIAELGGGSLEVSLADDSGILATECHSMGAVRLLEVLAGSDEDPSRFRRVLTQYLDALKVPAIMNRDRLAGFIATGGNIESLARMAAVPMDGNGVSKLPMAKLREVMESLFGLSYQDRVEKLSLKEDRADVILPAAMIYSRLAELIGVDEVIVPYTGIKEGLFFDLVDEITGRGEPPPQTELYADERALGRRYFYDEKHCVHVTMLALGLFDSLHDLHQLGAGDRRLLSTAAMLHDIGLYLGAKAHHKHSAYIIRHSPISFLSAHQKLMVANITRYHRKREPSTGHRMFVALTEAERARVIKLASILRVADALDREHRQKVYSLRAEKKGSEVRLLVQGSGDLTIERAALKKKGRMFTKLFNLKLTIDETKYEREELISW